MTRRRAHASATARAGPPEPTAALDGVLVIDKPVGPTSHDIVASCRRALATRRIGHTGTLDPLASGVLPLVLGRATRLASLLGSQPKIYDVTVRLGFSTDTYDADGRVVAEGERDPATVTREELDAALGRFRGEFLQQPPAFSAKKIRGVPAYVRARRDRAVLPDPVRVVSYGLEILEHVDPRLVLRVTCGPGFYVRSLAHDLGTTLRCGGHVVAIRRRRSGQFDLSDAVPLEDVVRHPDASLARLRPIGSLLPHLPAVSLSAAAAKRATHGNLLAGRDAASAGAGASGLDSTPGDAASAAHRASTDAPYVRLFGPTGTLIGLAVRRSDGALHPTIVLV